MNQFFYRWIVSLSVILSMDLLWLRIMVPAFYKVYLPNIFGNQVKYIPVILFYLIYSLGLTYLIVNPSLQEPKNLYGIFLKGAILGCMAYGAYDLTNHATLSNWKTIVTIVDMFWGTLVTGLTVTISYLLLHR